MKRSLFCLALTSAVALSVAPLARADMLVTTTGSWNGSDNVHDFGTSGSATYGQTITAPSAPTDILESFTFFMRGPSTQSFRGYVYAWDGSKATGPALYTSPTTSLAGGAAFEPITFSMPTDGLTLTPGSQYVLFASVADPAVAASSVGSSAWGQPGSSNVYGGGQFVFQNALDPSAWTSTTWSTGFLGTNGDLAFQARFGAVPEPTSIALLAIGGSAGLVRAWRRRRRPAVA